jgi:hypothetical protein
LPGGVVAATFPNTQAAIVVGNSGRTIFNGFLTDTFSDGPEGVQLYINEINFVVAGLQQAAIPEQASMIVWSLLGLTICGIRWPRWST